MMGIDAKKAAILAATFFLGGAAYAAVTSSVGRRVCVSLVGKGLKLKDGVACSLVTAKENIDDIVAEARQQNDGSCCDCEETGNSRA
ncbi:MAG: hypothetical protein LBT08_03680 [Synergistaceae bacterium]|jgi:hypothetical protein|nr:hypothetical protein [Synergistaceae bacterium]